jgi:hypothetical protein
MFRNGLALTCVASTVLGVGGCNTSPTPADVAAREYIDAVVESRERMGEFTARRPTRSDEISEAERTEIAEIVAPIRITYVKFAGEVAKMSPAEREAFAKKWEPRFEAAGVPMR